MSITTPDARPESIPPETLATYLRDRLERRVVDHEVAYGQLTVTVAPDALPAAAQLCRDDPRLAFDFFDFMSGVDEREDGFAVVVHLYSTHHRHHVQLRALAEGGRDEPRLPTISHIYRGADWHERETYDMFGIVFEGHPGLLPRILTVENFEGFPLRKEFLLMTREVKPWPGLKEPAEAPADDEGDGAADGQASGPSAEDKARMAREKAERAKAKAAEARKRRAQERVAEQGGVAEKDAALSAGAGDEETAGDPQEAAATADVPAAKDAAAGAVGGDTAAGAPGDVAGGDQPVEDRGREEELAGGGPARPSGSPGVEAEGRHGGALEQAGDRPAADTPGMISDTQDSEPARDADETPAPSTEHAVEQPEHHDEPRALADGGVDVQPLAETVEPEVGATEAVDSQGRHRPIGTDADDRLRDFETEAPDAGSGEEDTR